jgi:hypothetical protein
MTELDGTITDTPAKLWRDLRDGPLPPAYFEFARRVLAKGYEQLCPPLTPRDVLMLCSFGLATRFFYPEIKREGHPDMFAYGVMDVRALCSIIHKDPVWADRAGILWAPGAEAQQQCAIGALSAWMEEDLHPALGGPWCTTRDESTRGRALKSQWQQIYRGFFKPDYATMAQKLERVVVDNVGGNELDARRRQRLKPEEKLAWFKFIGDRNAFDTDVYVFTEQAMQFDQPMLARLLAADLDEGADLRAGVKSLFAENAEGGSLLDTQADKAAAEPEDELGLRELRDLRDLYDLERSHRLLAGFVSAAEPTPELAARLAPIMARLLPALDAIEDPALRAAVVYEFGKRGGDARGVWSRRQVAESYGATEREVECRAPAASGIVANAVAA